MKRKMSEVGGDELSSSSGDEEELTTLISVKCRKNVLVEESSNFRYVVKNVDNNSHSSISSELIFPPRVTVSGTDIRAKEVILVLMALCLLVCSVCLFFKHWKKNYRDINQLPYYAYLYQKEPEAFGRWGNPDPVDIPAPPNPQKPSLAMAMAAAAMAQRATFAVVTQPRKFTTATSEADAVAATALKTSRNSLIQEDNDAELEEEPVHVHRQQQQRHRSIPVTIQESSMENGTTPIDRFTRPLILKNMPDLTKKPEIVTTV